MRIEKTRRRELLPALLLTMTWTAQAHDHELFVRVQDAVGAPGGPAVISLRTYSTRPISQGTICLAMRGANGASPPVAAFKGARVFGDAQDVIERFEVREQNGEMIIDLTFASPSASINRVDGPIAALYLTVAPDAVPESEIDVTLDLGATSLRDEYGALIPIVQRGGELSIRDPRDPLEVAAEAHLGDLPGDPVILSLQTNEPFAIGSAQVAIHYSPRQLIGPGRLIEDPRFGVAKIKLDPEPGLLMIDVLGADNSFNELPGNILSVRLDLHPALTPDIEPEILLDPALTHFFDTDGNWIPIEIEDAVYALPRAPAPPPRDDRKTGQQQP